ncbi:MAG: hypothetical protein QNJ68_09775 [Microcoleaceae cyanobacterium MO_207.B10]|nr:hypothetical protein [Microcoleaceae cyanobacterium MO_207.B10]
MAKQEIDDDKEYSVESEKWEVSISNMLNKTFFTFRFLSERGRTDHIIHVNVDSLVSLSYSHVPSAPRFTLVFSKEIPLLEEQIKASNSPLIEYIGNSTIRIDDVSSCSEALFSYFAHANSFLGVRGNINDEIEIDRLNELFPLLSQYDKLYILHVIATLQQADGERDEGIQSDFIETWTDLADEKNAISVIQSLANSLEK